MPFDLIRALSDSPYPERLTAAAALMASGRHVEAVALLGETIASLDASRASSRLLEPFLQLSAEGLRTAAARFASSHPYSSRVDQRMRITWLEQALELYQRLNDVPNEVSTLRALALANMAIGESFAAMFQLIEVWKLARPLFLLDVKDIRVFFGQLADASQAAYEKAVDHRLGLHYNLAIESLAYRYLAGNQIQVMADLDLLHERYLQAAQEVHRIGTHERAHRLLAQGIYWGLVTGHAEVLDQYADLFVNYSALKGDSDAVAVYDRAITLRRAGSHDLAQRLVVEYATAALARMPSATYLHKFHDIIDEGTQYQMDAVDLLLKKENSADAAMPRLADAKRRAALLQLTSWTQTLQGLVPAFLKSTQYFPVEEFIDAGFAIALQRAHPAFGDADRRLEEYHRAQGTSSTSPVNVDLMRRVSVVQWSDPESVRLFYFQMASHFDCTPAEVELALVPRGVGSPIERRIRQSIGDFSWDYIRRTAMARGLLDQFRIWDKRHLPKSRH